MKRHGSRHHPRMMLIVHGRVAHHESRRLMTVVQRRRWRHMMVMGMRRISHRGKGYRAWKRLMGRAIIHWHCCHRDSGGCLNNFLRRQGGIRFGAVMFSLPLSHHGLPLSLAAASLAHTSCKALTNQPLIVRKLGHQRHGSSDSVTRFRLNCETSLVAPLAIW